MDKAGIALLAAATIVWVATATILGALSVDCEEELNSIKQNRKL